MSEQKSFVVLATFNGSGSSAIRDLLKEFEGFYECKAEIRFLTDSYGIIQLERALVDDWDWIASAGAINNFLKLCKKCCRKKSYMPWARYGLGYKDTINPNFMEITYKYINRLSKYTYREDFYDNKSQKNYFRYCLDRIRYGIEFYSKGKIKTANRRGDLFYFAKPTREEFYEATKDYLEELYEPHFKNGCTHIILDQALTAGQSKKIHDYFRNSKLLISERDPRDMYANELRLVNLNKNCYTEEYAHNYCLRIKAMHEGIPENDPDIMPVQFESLICNYNYEKKRIADFLGVPLSKHKEQFKYLDPRISIKNVCFAEKRYPQYTNVYKVIEDELPEYIYHGNTELQDF